MRLQRLYWFYLLFLALDLAILLVLPQSARAAVIFDEAGLELPSPAEIGGPQLRLATTPANWVPAIQLSAQAHFQVTGLVAQVRLEQSFRNDTGDWVQGEYLFPLPDGAAVNHLELVIGERVIVGEIKEKEAAREVYRQAAAMGHKASLVEQRRPNLFSNRVANIAPGETVTVVLDYVQRVTYDSGEFSLRFPMTVTPRYSPPGHPGAAEVWQFLNPVPATTASPIQPIALTATINPGLALASVDSAYHPVTVTHDAGHYRVALAEGAVPMNRDFLLRWSPPAGSEPRAAVFQEVIDGAEYALLMVLPPSAPVSSNPLPRELVFVIDTSGSMGGVSIAQARASLDFALGQLRPADRFNIIEFNSSARRLYREPRVAHQHNLAQALEFVRHLDAGGGTEMRSALELALPQPAPERSDYLRQVVFITDGAVGNEVELFREISQRLGASRLFTVGIGSAPNSWFMRKAAQVGRGDFTFIGDVGEVQQQMQDLFDRLGQTLVADIEIDWPTTVETYPRAIPDLYPGQPLLVTARAGGGLQGAQLKVRGRSGSDHWEQELEIEHPAAGLELAYSGIGSLWARGKIGSLLDEKILGRDESEVRAAILPVALQHRLVSPYTSFVAVEQQPSRPREQPLQGKPVPNLRPEGQSAQSFAYPNTATSAREQLLLGLILLVIACACWRRSACCWA